MGRPPRRWRHGDHRLPRREEGQVRKLGASPRGARNSVEVHRSEPGEENVLLKINQLRIRLFCLTTYNWSRMNGLQ